MKLTKKNQQSCVLLRMGVKTVKKQIEIGERRNETIEI